MQYLTTHDIVWINNSVTGTTLPYNYVTLESAMAGQYSYGQSQDVPGQAANLLKRLITTPPFASGNKRTALIAALAFLNANGYTTSVTDEEAAAIVSKLASGEMTPQQAIASLCAPDEATLQSGLSGAVSLRKLISHECNAHAEALSLLAAGD
jgi:death-on-curing family protein